ncbi:MAG TPA: hypothetical protein VMF90_06000 [Rhizobiaceae bacterium]|nr:hypothetical protein [Rhizobiaceae bacterium]
MNAPFNPSNLKLQLEHESVPLADIREQQVVNAKSDIDALTEQRAGMLKKHGELKAKLERWKLAIIAAEREEAAIAAEIAGVTRMIADRRHALADLESGV